MLGRRSPTPRSSATRSTSILSQRSAGPAPERAFRCVGVPANSSHNSRVSRERARILRVSAATLCGACRRLTGSQPGVLGRHNSPPQVPASRLSAACDADNAVRRVITHAGVHVRARACAGVVPGRALSVGAVWRVGRGREAFFTLALRARSMHGSWRGVETM